MDCSIPNCRTCTDVLDDAIIDLRLRDKFIRSSRSLKALHRKQLDSDQVILLPYRICGFSLHNRKWYPLNVALLQPMIESIDLGSLVLPKEQKSMLSALVTAHTSGGRQSNNSKSKDVVENKGTGTVILLHGPPGVGKTLVAEVLSSTLNRPLFTIRVADLGVTAREVEQSVIRYLKLAERWNSILLFRDADAILKRRSLDTDREENSIFSGKSRKAMFAAFTYTSVVFLDALEYFSGILILTTNRVGIFDEAFRSRIHLFLYFPPFDLDATMSIWENSLKHLQTQGNYIIEYEDILGLHVTNSPQRAKDGTAVKSEILQLQRAL